MMSGRSSSDNSETHILEVERANLDPQNIDITLESYHSLGQSAIIHMIISTYLILSRYSLMKNLS